ncbi:polysaccharide pyruvyl transferase family protein [Mesorhizobium sp. KR2-14]|uniref:polysaccharide pyruvyl transferase family protein n=1 Tax=Mesorhizobium sp. KR2-14 TaxID=3156610 RepID=UPI0032B35B03
MIEVDGKIPMRWWNNEKNFGDLLGPWLVQKMTGKQVFWAEKDDPHYLVIGSILSRVSPSSVLWGIGSFGSEGKGRVELANLPLAVRGPLTRARLEMFKSKCPRVYGDPALFAPDYYSPKIDKTHEIGLVLRWSEHERKEKFAVEGVKVIDLLTDDIEGTIDAILSCKRIITTSLHGLILADAYGIPNAWLIADTGSGKEHKFWDYLLSVGKVREPKEMDLSSPSLTIEGLINDLDYDDRPIALDLDPLRRACPFLARSPEIEAAETAAISGAKEIVRVREAAQARAERRSWWKPKNWPHYPKALARKALKRLA